MLSNKVRTLLKARLADATDGFNPTLVTTAALFGVEPFSISFEDGSDNFFEANIDLNSLAESTEHSLPLMLMHTVGNANRNIRKGGIFSGNITIRLVVALSFPSENIRNFELMGDAVESVLYQVLNNIDQQEWSLGIGWNGELTIARAPVGKGADNWVQPIVATLSFEVDQ